MAKRKGKKKGYGCLAALLICAILCGFASSSYAVVELIPGSVDLTGSIGKDGKAWQKVFIGNQIWFEGATSDTYETLFYITEPTADRAITFPNSSGTVSLLTSGIAPANSVNSAAIVAGTIAFSDLGSSIVNSATIKDGSIAFSDLGSSIVNTTTIKDGSVAEVDLASTAVTAGVTLTNTVLLGVAAASTSNTVTLEPNAVLLGVYPFSTTGLINSVLKSASYTTASGSTVLTVPATDTDGRSWKLVFLRP